MEGHRQSNISWKREDKKRDKLGLSNLSLLVNSLVQNSNSLLEDLRRLSQLKDIQNQTDIVSPKIDKPNYVASQLLKKVPKLKR